MERLSPSSGDQCNYRKSVDLITDVCIQTDDVRGHLRTPLVVGCISAAGLILWFIHTNTVAAVALAVFAHFYIKCRNRR